MLAKAGTAFLGENPKFMSTESSTSSESSSSNSSEAPLHEQPTATELKSYRSLHFQRIQSDEEQIAVLRAQIQADEEAKKAAAEAATRTQRTIPVFDLPAAEPALSQHLGAIINQEINRLQGLQQPGRVLTLSDVLSGPLHP